MCFNILNKEKTARYGRLKTKTKIINTPFFLPLATKSTVKALTFNQLKEIGVEAVIMNTFILHLNPGENLISSVGGLHSFSRFNGIIFTDSGGFQMLNKEFLVKVSDKGVIFRSPYDGHKELLTPENIVEIEYKLNSDIAMVLDHVLGYGYNKNDYLLAIRRTIKWAVRSLKRHKQLINENNIKDNKKQLLFAINQGGIFNELRKRCQKELNKYSFDGYAIGGLAIGEPMHKMLDSVRDVISIMPRNKIRYLMGVGSIREMIEAIALGVDCFDSAIPTKNARHGHLFTSYGIVRIKKAIYKDDKSAIDQNCNCYVCKNYSRAYIHHLIKENEITGKILTTYHNLYFFMNLIRTIRKRIKEGTFFSWKKEFLDQFDENLDKSFIN